MYLLILIKLNQYILSMIVFPFYENRFVVDDNLLHTLYRDVYLLKFYFEICVKFETSERFISINQNKISKKIIGTGVFVCLFVFWKEQWKKQLIAI